MPGISFTGVRIAEWTGCGSYVSLTCLTELHSMLITVKAEQALCSNSEKVLTIRPLHFSSNVLVRLISAISLLVSLKTFQAWIPASMD